MARSPKSVTPRVLALLRHTPSGHEGNGRISQAQDDRGEDESFFAAREKSVPLWGMKTKVKYHIPLLPLRGMKLWKGYNRGMKAKERISQAFAASVTLARLSLDPMLSCYGFMNRQSSNGNQKASPVVSKFALRGGGIK